MKIILLLLDFFSFILCLSSSLKLSSSFSLPLLQRRRELSKQPQHLYFSSLLRTSSSSNPGNENSIPFWIYQPLFEFSFPRDSCPGLTAAVKGREKTSGEPVTQRRKKKTPGNKENESCAWRLLLCVTLSREEFLFLEGEP